MNIKLVLPYRTMLDQPVDKITAPGTEGSFQVLPKHIDVVWSLQPGILTLTKNNQDEYYAIQQGTLVKEGDAVVVSTFQAVKGESLEKLHESLMESVQKQDEKEKKAREALVKLETDTIRRFMEIES
ncbi:F0F1 ATP synthase subunit epsilon [Anoxynatronum buryatiense]|uniref:F-type H+-transporting ATPase subunit epsilon n=1 Tax=Anoxynatronum buryatiense TaxID=489973 RepID=A0AA45WVA1_9CLOT|nr:F0F1 ATP synthase subunit epsilon [Anoxynatronum buryatiense]SMP52078.1 F-type H+-transporting ATPase subunit epsilon [Anoxynatronum buryatiense]